MRTTLTLDADVAQKLKKQMAARKLTLKEAVNQAIRAGLDTPRTKAKTRFRVEPHSCGLKAGVDPDKLNQLVDEMETEILARRLAR